jgi:hypothetical protein
VRLTLVLLVGLVSVGAVVAPRGHARARQAAPPRRGESVVIEPTSGSTFYREPGRARRPLTAETNVPVNTVIDATNGRMGIESANGAADFFDGTFVIREPKQQQPVTQLWLAGPDPRGCKARTPQVVRQLWGDGKGRFQTRGRCAAATVRGTKWRVQDRCDGTFVTVESGVVAVRDFRRRRTVVLTAGQTYLARR